MTQELTTEPHSLGTLEAKSAFNIKLAEDILTTIGASVPYTADGGNLTLEFNPLGWLVFKEWPRSSLVTSPLVLTRCKLSLQLALTPPLETEPSKTTLPAPTTPPAGSVRS